MATYFKGSYIGIGDVPTNEELMSQMKWFHKIPVPGELIILTTIDTYFHKEFPDTNYVNNQYLQVYG